MLPHKQVNGLPAKIVSASSSTRYISAPLGHSDHFDKADKNDRSIIPYKLGHNPVLIATHILHACTLLDHGCSCPMRNAASRRSPGLCLPKRPMTSLKNDSHLCWTTHVVSHSLYGCIRSCLMGAIEVPLLARKTSILGFFTHLFTSWRAIGGCSQ